MITFNGVDSSNLNMKKKNVSFGVLFDGPVETYLQKSFSDGFIPNNLEWMMSRFSRNDNHLHVTIKPNMQLGKDAAATDFFVYDETRPAASALVFSIEKTGLARGVDFVNNLSKMTTEKLNNLLREARQKLGQAE